MAALLLGGCIAMRGPLTHDPLTAEEHLQLGVSYENAGKLDLALREYERAASGPKAATALTCQGNIHLTRQNLPAAEAKYRAAIAVEPDQVHALNNLAWLLAREGRLLAEAEQLIRRALALNPEPRAAYEDTLQTILRVK